MLENVWFISIVSGIISSVLIMIFIFLKEYYSRQARWERKRLKYCRIAIKNMIDRFNISCWSGHPLGPMITYEHYIWILFELLCVINKYDSYNHYTDDEFKEAAEDWFNSYKKENMESAIMPYSITEIANIMLEVNSYGINGKPYIEKIMPRWLRLLITKLKNKWYYLTHNKTSRINDILYNGAQIPTDKTTKFILKHIEK